MESIREELILIFFNRLKNNDNSNNINIFKETRKFNAFTNSLI